MANTFTQITIQVIYAVKFRENVITCEWRNQLHQYISGILTGDGLKSLAVGGWKDHVHMFFGMPPTRNLSDVVRIAKASSSKWVNENKFVRGHFQWQDGYGGFSYSVSQRDRVIKYIMNQEQHHGGMTFRDEYLSMLNEFDIQADDRYLFDFYD